MAFSGVLQERSREKSAFKFGILLNPRIYGKTIFFVHINVSLEHGNDLICKSMKEDLVLQSIILVIR